MKRLSTGVLAVLFAAGLGLNALAAPAMHGSVSPHAIAQADTSAPPADFGSPPSGSVPILFNDHHVYTKPDVLKQGRVLAALVRGGTVLIPLRSMFEQMGATVAYDASSKTVDVTKPGADVKVTVGKPEVIINGESRPLDVPPMMYQGQVLVPVRVISEGMGAYVEWEPDKRLVVVRYMPATPPPAPAPTVAPTEAPTPAPTATPYKDAFIAGDYIISPKVYNEFSPGNTGGSGNGGFSFNARGALEFDLFNIPWMVEGTFTQINYPHTQNAPTPLVTAPCAPIGDPACVTVIGGNGSTFVPAFRARDTDFTGHLGVKVLDPRVYVGVGYMWRSNNYGYPQLKNWGYGASKLPDLDQPFTWYAEIWNYQNVRGVYGPTGQTLAYNVLQFEGGVTFTIQNSPLFIEGGFWGDRGVAKTNAPVTFTHSGPYVGLGLKF